MKKKIAIVLTLVLTFMAGAAFASASIKLTLNGKEIKTDVQPRMVNNRLLVPVRAAAEATGSAVDWDPKTSTVGIITPENIWDDPFPFEGNYSDRDTGFTKALGILNLYLATYTGSYITVGLPPYSSYVYPITDESTGAPGEHVEGTGAPGDYIPKYEILDARVIGGSKDEPIFEFAVRMWRHSQGDPEGVYDVFVISYIVGFVNNEANHNQGYYVTGQRNIDSKYLKNIVYGHQIKYDPWALSH
ncbi:copper amine oxidase N-terminal domain-containing protein [Calorimonas adulescens]|uniref:Copper amine oxidase N-terminal domain-containing protein n=1 Tax=Calorimonas adulescens TaxID=2606906 RepID=A0A5D8QEP7_9THEO|nr:copper amine oxidase N-terminal domain-containing protein [Calorimonas adulescens]TZE82316.1 copper amine oxidase N-terminal domain-containing protein [Calorimonas adulescens]